MSTLNDFRVAILANDGIEEPELMEPVNVLKAAGAHVTLLSVNSGKIQAVRHDLDKSDTRRVSSAQCFRKFDGRLRSAINGSKP
jgi:protease I